MRKISILTLLLGLLAAPAASPGEPVAFQTLTGQPASLAPYLGQGKWLVVKIWASDCHVCNETVHEMVALAQRHAQQIQVLGIAVDGIVNRPGVDDYLRRHSVNFPTLIDDGQGAATLYARDVQRNWRGWTPTYLLYTPQGKLAAQNIGAIAADDVLRFVSGFAAAPES